MQLIPVFPETSVWSFGDGGVWFLSPGPWGLERAESKEILLVSLTFVTAQRPPARGQISVF